MSKPYYVITYSKNYDNIQADNPYLVTNYNEATGTDARYDYASPSLDDAIAGANECVAGYKDTYGYRYKGGGAAVLNLNTRKIEYTVGNFPVRQRFSIEVLLANDIEPLDGTCESAFPFLDEAIAEANKRHKGYKSYWGRAIKYDGAAVYNFDTKTIEYIVGDFPAEKMLFNHEISFAEGVKLQTADEQRESVNKKTLLPQENPAPISIVRNINGQDYEIQLTLDEAWELTGTMELLDIRQDIECYIEDTDNPLVRNIADNDEAIENIAKSFHTEGGYWNSTEGFWNRLHECVLDEAQKQSDKAEEESEDCDMEM